MQIHQSCPDLRYIDKKIQILEDELRSGYVHPAAAGHTIIEINQLIEEHRERFNLYLNRDQKELSEYTSTRK